jgi:hypothetical protein
MFFRGILSLCLVMSVSAFMHSSRITRKYCPKSVNMVVDSEIPELTQLVSGVMTNSLMLATERGDDYVYGAVSAPSWALPVGAVLAVLTAALPFLLRPGEDALNQQRLDEAETKSGFGMGDNSAKKRRDRL